MTTIVNTAALQPRQLARTSDHVLASTWRDAVATAEVAFGAAVRLRAVGVATVPAAAAAHTPGSVAWSPPPC